MYFTETHIYIPTAYFTLQKHTVTHTDTLTHIHIHAAINALYRNKYSQTHCIFHSTEERIQFVPAILHST